jgi:hypothetical protein
MAKCVKLRFVKRKSVFKILICPFATRYDMEVNFNYLLYKCVVAKLGSKAGNFSSRKREKGGERD